MNSANIIDITPNPGILSLLQHLRLTPARAICEIIDNCIDNFAQNNITTGTVTINASGSTLTIIDNGTGMNVATLQSALRVAESSKPKHGTLGLFGIGLNVACSVLGSSVEINTKTKDDEFMTSLVLDSNQIRRNNSFHVEYERLSNTLGQVSGTRIRVNLHERHVGSFRGNGEIQVREELAKSYSFLLRDGVPGLSKAVGCGRVKLNLVFNGRSVAPYIPCVWSEHRFSEYGGTQVRAVEYIDEKLPKQKYCTECYESNLAVSTVVCPNCKKSSFDEFEPRIWGWIGIQRFLDTHEYGLSFIRNGRAILINDKSVFTFVNQDSGRPEVEYPIEMPANMGRIVGEIHCDHVPPEALKTDFDREHDAWKKLMRLIRGNTSLKPRQATENNVSPLFTIFQAFRRNDPGLKYLGIGNGEKATNAQSKLWYKKFVEGDPEFLQDDKWYEAAKNHDELKRRQGSAADDATNHRQSVQGPVVNPFVRPADVRPSVSKTSTIKTVAEQLAELQSGSIERLDLRLSAGAPKFKRAFEAHVWLSELPVDTHAGGPCIVIRGAGSHLHCFVYSGAIAVRTFGRSIVDLAFMELAHHLKIANEETASVAAIFTHLLEQVPSEARSANTLFQETTELLAGITVRIVDKCGGILDEMWSALGAGSQNEIKELIAVRAPERSWEGLVGDGSWIRHIEYRHVWVLTESFAAQVLNNHVFNRFWPDDLAEHMQKRVSESIKRPLMDIDLWRRASTEHLPYETELCQLAVKTLTEMLSNDQEDIF